MIHIVPCGTKDIFRSRRFTAVVKSRRMLDSVKLLKGLFTNSLKVIAGRKKDSIET